MKKKIYEETRNKGSQEKFYEEGRKAGRIFTAINNAGILCLAWRLIKEKKINEKSRIDLNIFYEIYYF